MDGMASSTANVAIGRMVVVIPSGQSAQVLKRQRTKAAEWVTSEEVKGLPFDVVVTTGIVQLAPALGASMQDTDSKVSLAANHGNSATDKSIAAPPHGSAHHASHSKHRWRTPSPVYLYKPDSQCPRSTPYLQHASKSVALPLDGAARLASTTGHWVRTPSPIYLYKPQASSSPFALSALCLHRATSSSVECNMRTCQQQFCKVAPR